MILKKSRVFSQPKFLFLLTFIISHQVLFGQIRVENLRTEYLNNPVGIGVTKPRFYWKLSSEQQNQVQTAYQVLVASSPALLRERKTDLWNSGKVDSDQSIHVEYDGRELQSRDRCWWTVRVWDKDGKPSKWSEPAYFEMGLLSPDDWKAKWIKTSIQFEEYSYPSPMLRKEFLLDKKVKSARAYVTSLGLYEFYLNGKKVGDYLLTPGFTSYSKRLQYQVYDLTSILQKGTNAAGIILGNGWHRNFRAYGPPHAPNMEERKLQDLEALAQIEVLYTDGTEETITTDVSWKSTTGPILMTSIYHGETYDATKEKAGWLTPGYQDSDWKPVEVVARGKENLVATVGKPVKRIEEIEPVKVIYTPGGDTVLDMGQNMAGWCRLKVNCPKGTTITLRHGEVLDKYGNFYTANLRSAKQTITYTCKGGGPEVYEPRFTYQGFRYVAISGYPGEVTPGIIDGVVIHTDMERTGYFSCSDSLINQLHESAVWSMRGNLVDIPTDCPQRDERLGWMGGPRTWGRASCNNFLMPPIFTKWLKDIAADQEPTGSVHRTAPSKLNDKKGAAGQGDAAVIIPWMLYQRYGDRRVLEEQYPSMKGWVDYLHAQVGDSKPYLWFSAAKGPGDWLAYQSDRDVDNLNGYPGATTDVDYLSSAYFFYSTHLLSKIAGTLGNKADSHHYQLLSEKIKADFIKEFITSNARISPNTQTAYAVAIAFGLLPDSLNVVAAKRLAGRVDYMGHITTGMIGVSEILPVLTEYGYLKKAYSLLFREEYPSWLYQIKKGATTLWERWDGIKTDSTFQTTEMNSFNHPHLACINDWLYRYMAGIGPNPQIGGYKSFIIQPFPDRELKNLEASYESLYGTISSEWKIEGNRFKLKVEIPVNTTATIFLPSTADGVSLNGKPLAEVSKERPDNLPYYFQVVEIGSGSYELESSYE